MAHRAVGWGRHPSRVAINGSAINRVPGAILSAMDLLPAWLGGRTSCPASTDEKRVVEDAFTLLRKHLGIERLRKAVVVEPTPEFFPDRYDASLEAAKNLFVRVCGYMEIADQSVRLSFWQDAPEVPLPVAVDGTRTTQGAAGFYAQGAIDVISLNVAGLGDPEALIATMAHELAHVILLSRCGVSRDEPHMEALTDLATVYLGLGIFTSNTLLRRHGWIQGTAQYWRLSRKGYISPEMAGWALSLFAWVRGETAPYWSRHLAADPKGYLKQGLRYLRQTGETSFS